MLAKILSALLVSLSLFGVATAAQLEVGFGGARATTHSNGVWYQDGLGFPSGTLPMS